MEPVLEDLKAVNRKKEIFSQTAELLEEVGLLTKEEKNCMKDMIWQDEKLLTGREHGESRYL